MRTWVIKKKQFSWPHDLICVEIDDEHLLFIQEDGQCDICHASMGYPTKELWWEF